MTFWSQANNIVFGAGTRPWSMRSGTGNLNDVLLNLAHQETEQSDRAQPSATYWPSSASSIKLPLYTTTSGTCMIILYIVSEWVRHSTQWNLLLDQKWLGSTTNQVLLEASLVSTFEAISFFFFGVTRCSCVPYSAGGQPHYPHQSHATQSKHKQSKYVD